MNADYLTQLLKGQLMDNTLHESRN